MVFVAQAIGGVGVATEQDAGPAAAHALEDFNIPTRFALELDALIARGQLALDDRKQLWNRGLNADGNAADNGFAHAAQQLGKRDAFTLRLQVPHGVFKRGLGHLVAAHGVEDARAIAAVLRRLGREHWRQLLNKNLPGSVGGFAGEIWALSRGAFSPAAQSFRLDLGEHNPAVAGDSKAGFKRTHQRHMQFAEDDRVNSHRWVS